mgnify:CR=1 FL=1
MNKFSILLLDDVSENIYSLKLLIEENFDINIFTALKAQEAIEIVMNNTIDLILTDVQMPDVDGFEFAQYLKDVESTKNIPVIFRMYQINLDGKKRIYQKYWNQYEHFIEENI